MTKWKGEAASYAPKMVQVALRAASVARLLPLALLTGLAASPASGADKYWDINGNTTGLGGSGTWNLTNPFWNSSSTGTGGTVTVWDNAALDNAIFGSTAGTVTLGVPITVHNITFNSAYTITGSTLTLAGATPTITENAGGVNYSINSVLAGTNGVTFTGNTFGGGGIILGATNTITGGININGLSVAVSAANGLNGANNVVTVNNGGVLVVNSNSFGGDTAASRLVVNSGGRLSVNNGNTLTHDVTLTGGTPRIETGGTATWNGTAVLTANSQLRFAGGTLNVTGNLSDTGANVLSLQTEGGAVHFSGNLGFSGDFTLAGGQAWFDGGTQTYSGDTVITGGSLLLNSAGTLSPNTNIRFAGHPTANTAVVWGTNAVPSITLPVGTGDGQISWAGSGNGSGGFYALNNQSDVTVNLGGASAPLTWGVGGFVQTGQSLILGTNVTGATARQVDFQNPIDFNGAVRTVRVDNGSITDHALLSGQLTGTGGLQIVGSGALELTNTSNSYSGATVVGDAVNQNQGALILNAAGTLPASSNLQLNGNSAFWSYSGTTYLTAASGPFTQAVGTGGGQVQWTASGGFGAIGGPRTVNLFSDARTLTWGSGGFVPTGQVLRFGGNFANSTVNFQNGLDLGASDRVISVSEGQGAGFNNTSELEVNLNGVIQGTGGLVLAGDGDAALNALNTYSGTTWIGGNTVGGTGDGMWVWANTLADAGTASSLGTGSTVVLASHVGGLIYTGGATSTNRALALNETNGGVLHLFNYGSGALTWTGNITTTGSGQNDLRLGGTYATTTDANGVAVAPNVVSGVISDGSGVTRIRGWNSGSYATGEVWRLTGANTFTGELSPDGGVFEATTIRNAGTASAVGAGNLIADFRGLNGTLRYIGSGDTSDRLFDVWSNSHLESSGTGPLVLTNTGFVVTQNGGFTHWLGGTNTGDNILSATLVDSPTPVEFTTSWFRLGKEGPGLWALATNNNAQANAYSHNTIINGGALRLDNAGAITGGLGVTSSHGATGSSQRSSMVLF